MKSSLVSYWNCSPDVSVAGDSGLVWIIESQSSYCNAIPTLSRMDAARNAHSNHHRLVDIAGSSAKAVACKLSNSFQQDNGYYVE